MSQMAGAVDRESAEWLRDLTGGQREAAQARLHAVLVRIARGEVRRRAGGLQVSGPELDDLIHQAAADALLAIIAKLGQFRGESRFTTWAYKFVIFGVSAKVGRHFWRHPQGVAGGRGVGPIPWPVRVRSGSCVRGA